MEKLSGYYEMPMAIGVRIVMTGMIVEVAGVVITAMIVTVLMVVVAMTMPMLFLRMFFVGLASFDMDVGNVVSGVAMPQYGAEPRDGSRVKQE